MSGTRFRFDGAAGLGACGDWTAGARASDAFDAGVECGRAVAESIESELYTSVSG